ncbi:hypothetical protein [Pseudoroseicyclus sp. CXY001]|uniref:hypothetical protein n=1 Tax=Pseudoroseicyclus sp. CXY001 TaxID=3242492 RepID=UPI003570EFF0
MTALPVEPSHLAHNRAFAVDCLTGAEDRASTMVRLTICNGGAITPACDGWGPHQWEISLFGVMGIGPDQDAAVANWIKCAARAIPPTSEPPPMPDDSTLRTICDRLDAARPLAMIDILRQEIEARESTFQDPAGDAMPAGVRAFVEVHLLGITGHGCTPREAAEHWRCRARTELGGYAAPAAPGDLARLRAQLRWLARTPIVSLRQDDARLAWARLVLAISSDAALHDRARRVFQQLGEAA